jgi:plastocyanin
MKVPVARVRAPVPAGAPAAPAAVAAAVPDVPPAPISAVAPVASTLGAEAFDFGTFVLRLTRPAVAAGTLTIYFRNRDVSDHNLWIDGPGMSGPLQVSGEVGENGTATKRVVVAAGSWRLYCSLPGHEAMSAALTVG